MSYKKFITAGILSVFFILGSCLDNGNPTNDNEDPSDTLVTPIDTTDTNAIPIDTADTNSTPVDTLKGSTYGTFLIKLIPENPATEDPAFTRIYGTITDGPSPPNIIFKEVMSSGTCKLMKAISPFCEDDCGGLGYKCVADDVCMAEPKVINVGSITVTGLKRNGSAVPITMEPPNSLYYQMIGEPLDYPPVTEGDTITLSATGHDSIQPFTIKTRGITPLVVLNDEILVEDGKPITINWVPPTIAGVSKIYIRINISYHGGTKGEIQYECDDNGSATIPGEMLDKLKSYGIAGYPLVDITRKSISSDPDANAKIIVECTITKLLTIPGVHSCDQDEDCPGQLCIDRRCQ